MSGWFNKQFDAKQLRTHLLGWAIVAVGSTLWVSLSKSTSHWFWEDARIAKGAALLGLLIALAALWTITVLIFSLSRARANAASAAADAEAARADADAAGARLADQLARNRSKPDQGARAAQKVGEGFEWSDRRRAVLRELLRRDGEVIERGELFGVVARWYLQNPMTAKAEFARDIEAAERASIIKILPSLGNANYILTPEGRNWLLSQDLGTAS